MKKIIFSALFIFLVLTDVNPIFAAWMVWESAVLECAKAAYKMPMEISSMGSINNPLDSKRVLQCKWQLFQDVLYQAILDVKFTEIDLKVEKYLESLKWKTKPVEVIEDLQKKFWINWDKWSFYNLYNDSCNSWIFGYAISFINSHPSDFPNINTNWTTKNYLNSPQCKKLAALKLKSYYDAWEVIAAREAVLWYEKSKKTFMKKIKKQYEALLFKMTVYMWQLWVIKDKWNTNTKKPGS